ncbi:MAG: DEAD/DEAH box helicase, partial [Armatimonadota bacterium]
MDASGFLEELQSSASYRGQIAHLEDLPAREARYAELAEPLPPVVRQMLEAQGFGRLYSHQARAADAARRGEDMVVVTGTASGKTLCYTIPILESAVVAPEATALYLFPTKALAQDQLRRLREYQQMGEVLGPIATYDGDTSRGVRAKLRDTSTVILTNPDMLHVSILPVHTKWQRFLANLRYVVVDELHSMRGIFGSHCANLFRRLNRLCERYGSQPTYICCSATIANPREHAEMLTERAMTLIDDDGAPRGPKKFAFWNPPIVDQLTQRRRSANVEAVELMAQLVSRDVRTIAFAKNWTSAELLARYWHEALARVAPRRADKVTSYRGGYLPSERREIEQRLFNGDLLGVTSTTALELGIDVGGLEASVIVGYPGTISSTWQQAGRAGRGQEESLAILVAYDTSINQYLMHHPDYFFGKANELALISPENHHILAGQLACAAQELPITEEELSRFGEMAEPVLALMEQERMARRMNRRWYYTAPGRPAQKVSLRNITSHTFNIVDVTDPRQEVVIGSIDQMSAYPILHPGAVYIHLGETYVVEELDLEQNRALLCKADVDYYTSPLGGRGVAVIHSVEAKRQLPGGEVWFGEVDAHFNTSAYDKMRFWSREPFDRQPVNLPPHVLNTYSYWVIPQQATIKRLLALQRRWEEADYGLGQALMVITAAYAHCYPLDVRCSEAPDASQTLAHGFEPQATFIFDNYQGGMGYAERAFEQIEEVLAATTSYIKECGCEDGCPLCVGFYLRPLIRHDPENTEGWIPDKEAALMVLHDVLGLPAYEPRPPSERLRTWRDRVRAARATPQKPEPVP